eukprot:11413819-Prorocentrum_lima.AAC.1
MTSSLVGSEMCIRDRLSEVPIVPQGIISTWLVTNGGPDAGQAVPYAAVSYTHLTLPTICSV